MVGQPLILLSNYFFRNYKETVSSISVITTIIARTNTTSHMQDKPFRQPQLTPQELHNGCRLGWDTWADTSCSGKHAYVDEFIVRKSVTATGFTASLGSVQNLPMANVLYAYDTQQGTTILLEHNNTIYLGKEMNDSLANPIQAEEEGVRIDL